ncbi:MULTISPECIES: TonB-dependent receptor plug domain-containing protein [unclassified Sphingobium]|uniref:TonB-dependent receptor plug domain-containing protein n=1 Tax=unclassified Sphingobium TaxID=2611147 RepID=UPI002224730A|nr:MULTISPECIES: TonB-dependent receptor [unclassified Sphingobium]MCW2395752.1 outer membrane receptor protein involved in Fe transport [Sphingobium sp. B8D3B]MCW2419267.1 outer membrane receptor protein involved in Fe transport [Sphingobium sp. B8D3C]
MALIIACPSIAAAQDSTSQPTEHAGQADPSNEVTSSEQADNQIIVTGSRIAKLGFTSPTPVTVIEQQQIRSLNPASLNDALRQLPVLADSVGPRGTTGSAGAGGSFLNLRRLGGPRTLVLLDGRRYVSTTQNGTVDTALFPEILISRIDVVTGGASAAYGSDAVSGVVNFVLNKSFTGLKGEALYGQIDGGYAPEYKASLAGGTSFGDGRGHFIASGEYYKSEGLWTVDDLAKTGYKDRRDCSVIQNPGGATARTFACGVVSSNSSPNGLITSGPLAFRQFDASGNLVPFNRGTLTSATTQVGGDGPQGNWRALLSPNTRIATFARASWEFSSEVTAYVEASWAKTHYAYPVGAFSGFTGSGALTIQRDNAYLTSQVADLMDQNRLTSIRVSRTNFDIPRPFVDQINKTTRIVAGLDGDIGGFKWSAYYQHGRNDISQTLSGVINLDRFVDTAAFLAAAGYPQYPAVSAVDAVRAPAGNAAGVPAGTIVCRSTLTNPNNGCVPINVMGPQTFTAAQLGYVTGTSYFSGPIKQNVVAITVNKDLFNLPGGAVTVAAGGEYRDESIRTIADPVSLAFSPANNRIGQFQTGNYVSQSGSVNVKEAFVEAIFPIFKDRPFFKELELNTAARYTDYSTSGGVTSWKVGLTWAPSDLIRFRATRSRDIRAANLAELFSAGTGGLGTVTDQATRNNPSPHPSPNPVQVITAGNRDLRPELANTWTAGAVITPSFIRGLSLAVDYYDINIKGAVGTPTANQVVLDCFNGSSEACSRITRDANGELTRVLVVPINLNVLKQNGLDIELAYSLSLADLTDKLDGRVSLRFLGNKVFSSYTQAPGTAVIDRTGEISTPDWRWTLNLGYQKGPLNVSTQYRFTGGGWYDVATLPTDLPQRYIKGQVLMNLNIDYTVKILGGRYTLFGNVQNVFDKTAPPFGNVAVSPTVFDTLGRTFRAGFRFEY